MRSYFSKTLLSKSATFVKFKENQLTVSGLSPFNVNVLCLLCCVVCVVALQPTVVVVVLIVLIVQY